MGCGYQLKLECLKAKVPSLSRTLVVTRLETGSLYAYLRDALHEFAPYDQAT